MLESLDIDSDPRLSLLEWRSDKTLGYIFPRNNSLPDLVLEVDGRSLAIECKWRKRLTAHAADEMLTPERRERFLCYSSETGTPVLLLLGTGGLPSYPDRLHLMPIASPLTYADLKNAEISTNELKNKLLSLPSLSQRDNRT